VPPNRSWSLRLVEGIDLLDDPRVFRSRVFFVAWAPVWLAGAVAETPNPLLGPMPWVLVVSAATLAVWPMFLLLGRIIALVRPVGVRRWLTPVTFGIVGLLRGALIAVLVDQFTLLAQQYWGMRLLGGFLAGVILTSAVAAVESLSARLTELQRESRGLRLEREAITTPLDEPVLHARWLAIVRETLEAHFAEQPRTPDARAVLERNGPERLAGQIERRLSEFRKSIAPHPLSLRARLTDTAHIRRLVELATARVGGVRVPLAVTLGLVVVAIHGGSNASAVEAIVTVVATMGAGGLAFVLATVSERVHRRALRSAPLWARFVIITLGLFVVGLIVGSTAGLVHRLSLGDTRPTIVLLLIGMVTAIAVLIGWASMVIDGLAKYSSLLSIENRQADALLARRRFEREQFVLAAAQHFDRAVEASWLPLVRAIARESSSWLSPTTRDRVLRSLLALKRSVAHCSVTEELDMLPRDWEGLALADCVVDDEVMQQLAKLPASESSPLIEAVRAQVINAVVELGAQTVEITIRSEGSGFAVESWHDGADAADAESR